MKEFLNFEEAANFVFTNDMLVFGRIIDRLLFYDCGEEQPELLNDIRYLRMLLYYFVNPDKENLSFDDDFKKSINNAVTRTINTLREIGEADIYLFEDLSELLAVENAVFNLLR